MQKWMLVAMLSIGLSAETAHSFPSIFFGEDLNDTDNPNTAQDDPMRPASLPHAEAAKAAFLANLIGVSSETFESYQDGTPPTSLTFGSTTATLAGNTLIKAVPTGTFNGAFPVSGSKFLFNGGGETGPDFAVTFSAPQAAIGFFATDVGDGDGQLRVTLVRGGETTTITVPHSVPAGSGSAFYFGLIDTSNPFTEIRFSNSRSSLDGFGFDDLTIGTTGQVGCLNIPDEDGDGEPDVSDKCPGTVAGAPVDEAGCSQNQFCARFDATTRNGKRLCRLADWKNDEPARARDCTLDKGGRGSADDRCVPVP